MNIQLLPAYPYPEEISRLFKEYADMIVKQDPSFKTYLEMQNFEDEIKHLETKYAPPDGRLYIVFYDQAAAGCIGLKKLDEKNCEMKRLYIRPPFRGNHTGSLLVQRIINDAKEIGYSHILLDTLPFLQAAIQLYKKYGFYEIPRYNNSPMKAAVYMKLDLSDAGSC